MTEEAFIESFRNNSGLLTVVNTETRVKFPNTPPPPLLKWQIKTPELK